MAERRIIPPGIQDAVATAYADLLGRFDVMDRAAVIPLLVERVTSTALPHLLEQMHVDFMRPDASSAVRRQAIKASIPWHRTKGTPGALVELVQLMAGVTPSIRERTYFLLGGRFGGSRLGRDSLCAVPAAPFCLGLAKLGSRLNLPRTSKYHFDIVIEHAAAVAASVVRADVAAMATAMMPARCRRIVRFRGFRLGDAYSQLGRDLLAN